ncbi:MAG: thiol peroxidase [Elusimicrobiota bacterium]|jgi:thiol peroxidase|nr:thiol peroxidase [Elusimicrobiota bacterium]
MERTVLANGQTLHLEGNALETGKAAPDFTLTATDMKDISLKSFKGNIVILSIVPSLDTPVCTLQTRRFNKEAATMADSVKFITISRDLPFAQSRWLQNAGADKIIALSDYKNTSFSKDYGVFIKEWFLLARSVFVLDKEGVVKYAEYVKDEGNEPDYNSALSAAKQLL